MGFPNWVAIKSPGDILDYTLDWSSWLNTDIIISANWTVPADLTVTSQNFTDTNTVIWISGGIDSNTYPLICKITTEAGRTCERTVNLKVKIR